MGARERDVQAADVRAAGHVGGRVGGCVGGRRAGGGRLSGGAGTRIITYSTNFTWC